MKHRLFAIINSAVVLWWGSIYVFIFNIERHGGAIHEPNKVVATAEFYLAVILLGWFVFQIIYYFGIVRRNEQMM
jgi:hypothetical protein